MASMLAIPLGSAMSAASIVSITNGTNQVALSLSNLITNGSFEAQVSSVPLNSFWATGTSMSPTVSLTGWTGAGQTNAYATWGNDGSPALGIKGSAPIPDGQVGLYFGAFIVSGMSAAPIFHPNGTITFASNPNIQADPLYGPVTLEQTLTGLIPGDNYLLDFWASGEAAVTGAWQEGLFGLDITGEATTYLAVPSGGGPQGAFQRYKVLFKPTFSTTTIKFTNWGHITSNGFASELCLDDVILNHQAVPEPPEWAALALGTIGILVGRRRSV